MKNVFKGILIKAEFMNHTINQFSRNNRDYKRSFTVTWYEKKGQLKWTASIVNMKALNQDDFLTA